MRGKQQGFPGRGRRAQNNVPNMRLHEKKNMREDSVIVSFHQTHDLQESGPPALPERNVHVQEQASPAIFLPTWNAESVFGLPSYNFGNGGVGAEEWGASANYALRDLIAQSSIEGSVGSQDVKMLQMSHPKVDLRHNPHKSCDSVDAALDRAHVQEEKISELEFQLEQSKRQNKSLILEKAKDCEKIENFELRQNELEKLVCSLQGTLADMQAVNLRLNDEMYHLRRILQELIRNIRHTQGNDVSVESIDREIDTMKKQECTVVSKKLLASFEEQITKKLMANKHVEMMENEEELTVYSGSNEGHRNRNVENSTSETSSASQRKHGQEKSPLERNHTKHKNQKRNMQGKNSFGHWLCVHCGFTNVLVKDEKAAASKSSSSDLSIYHTCEMCGVLCDVDEAERMRKKEEEANIREVEEALLSQERSPSVAVELVKSGETGTKSQDKDVCEHVENGMAVEESFSDSSKTFSAGSSDKDLAEKALPPMPQSLRVVRTNEGDVGDSEASKSNEEEMQEGLFVGRRENVGGRIRRK
ncbi:hypothetical protein GUITHDRAFT_142284 [Guillardia theta CCMP2712]|uniref:Uncharacterized protein n=1 Tax=Guillardia theta (strain CCMP2712) TaxID=905079 RepID=L1IZ77_GUITC|nr:hypothetical protein GUITHDRAFT_142284 [Guillardia theta CCMP2712]EKX41135.1 hypothetical protein GUITHDRAFT_142284 [Guillardia theta CCMP2712]|eukprot:XP_005828115.1 hypothetical protein GUITHDRAFT_142284 [Guillardia theta CCMP2712]